MIDGYMDATYFRLLEDARIDGKFTHKTIPYTNPGVCGELINLMSFKKTADIAVLFTVEMALWLKLNGFKKITVITDTECPFTRKCCEVWDFEYIIFKRGMLMRKFDGVVGNPPYDLTTEESKQREFYQQFVYQAHEIADQVGLIFPARWTSLNNATYKKFSNFMLDANMTHFKWLAPNTFPGVQMLTCYVITDQKNSYSKTIVEDQSGSQGKVDLKLLNYYPSDLTTVNLLTKLVNGSNIAYRAAAGSLYENQLVSGNYKIIFRAGRTNDPVPYYTGSKESIQKTALFGNHKVVVSRNGAERKLGPVKVGDIDSGVGFACFGLKTQSQLESENFCSYLETKVVKFIVDQYKRGTKGNSKELFSKIPDVNLSKAWTDIDVYNLFNLTDEERKYINDNY